MGERVIPLRSSVVGPFKRSGYYTAPVVPWYLAGGVALVNCLAAYQPIGAADLAASYENLANPGTYDAAPGSAPDFNTATGWDFNGSSMYLKTGVVPPASGQTWSMIVRFSDETNDASKNCWLCAVVGTSPYPSLGLAAVYTNSANRRYDNNGAKAITGKKLAGVMAVAGNQGYFDGLADGTALSSTDGTVMSDIYIGCRHARYSGEGNTDEFSYAKIQAFAVYDTVLTDVQVLAISTAMAAL